MTGDRFVQVRDTAFQRACDDAHLSGDGCTLLYRLALLADYRTGTVATTRLALAEHLRWDKDRLARRLAELAKAGLVTVRWVRGHDGRVILLHYPDLVRLSDDADRAVRDRLDGADDREPPQDGQTVERPGRPRSQDGQTVERPGETRKTVRPSSDGIRKTVRPSYQDGQTVERPGETPMSAVREGLSVSRMNDNASERASGSETAPVVPDLAALAGEPPPWLRIVPPIDDPPPDRWDRSTEPAEPLDPIGTPPVWDHTGVLPCDGCGDSVLTRRWRTLGSASGAVPPGIVTRYCALCEPFGDAEPLTDWQPAEGVNP